MLTTEHNKGSIYILSTSDNSICINLMSISEVGGGGGGGRECGHLQTDIVQKLFFLLISDNIGPGFAAKLRYVDNQQIWHPPQKGLVFFLL